MSGREKRPRVTSPLLAVGSPDTETKAPNLLEPDLGETPKLVRQLQAVTNQTEAFAALDKINNMMDDRNENMEKHRKEATRLGVHFHAHAIMRKWQNDEKVQIETCKCLALVAACSDDAGLAIADLGGIEDVLNAMKRFPNEAWLQAFACCVLTNVLCQDKVVNKRKALPYMHRFVDDIGGVDLVVLAMDNFPDETHVLLPACEFLWILSGRQELRDVMVKAGVARAIGAALAKHHDEVEVQRSGKQCMSNLFKGNDE